MIQIFSQIHTKTCTSFKNSQSRSNSSIQSTFEEIFIYSLSRNLASLPVAPSNYKFSFFTISSTFLGSSYINAPTSTHHRIAFMSREDHNILVNRKILSNAVTDVLYDSHLESALLLAIVNLFFTFPS